MLVFAIFQLGVVLGIVIRMNIILIWTLYTNRPGLAGPREFIAFGFLFTCFDSLYIKILQHFPFQWTAVSKSIHNFLGAKPWVNTMYCITGYYLLLAHNGSAHDGIVSMFKSPASESTAQSCMAFAFSIYVSIAVCYRYIQKIWNVFLWTEKKMF